MRRTLLLAAGLLAGASSCHTDARRDVVVVTLDTFRADRVGAYGNKDGLTPHLDRFAASGVLFEQASAAAPITLPSHASLFTGRYPSATGIRNNGAFVLPDRETTLAEALHGAGWATGAVIASFPVQSRYGLGQGFDVYDEDLPEAQPSADRSIPIFFPERDARAVTDRALEVWGRLGSGPRFLWAHYFDAHAPYTAPEPWGSRHASAPYDGEIAFVDDQVGRLLERIQADAPDAIVLIVADHGESLGEHGEKTHGVFLYQATIRVPFLLRAPRILDSGRRVAAPVSLVDAMPTILSLAGVPPPAGIQGSDLRGLASGGPEPARPVYAESYLPRLQFRFSELTMLRRGAHKYIEAPLPELYDVLQDPGEARSLHGGDPVERTLASDLARFRAAEDAGTSARAAGSLDPDAEAKLRSLGYAAAGTLNRNPGEGRGRDPKTMTEYLRRYDRAVGSTAAGKFDEAIGMLRGLIPEAPENFMVRYQLAGALMAAGRLDEARAELEAVVLAAPEMWNGYLLLAEVESRVGHVAEAVRHYRAAAAAAPRIAEPHFALARLLESVGRFDEAAASYLDALRREPDDREIARRLVDLRSGRGTPERCVDDFKTLTSELPRSPLLWAMLSEAQRRQADVPAAAAAARRALDLDAAHPDALLADADVALDAGRPKDAEGDLAKALKRAPVRVDLLFAHARALYALGRAAEADAAIGAILSRHPRYSPAVTLQGQFLEKRGDREGAAANYRRALAMNPGDVAAREGLRRLRP